MNDDTSKRPNGFHPLAALLWGLYLGLVFTALAVLVLSGNEAWSWEYWGGKAPDRSAVLRNIVLVAAAAIGFPLVVWRASSAHRQAAEANKQSEIANEQARITRHGMQVERFQKALEMLDEDESNTLTRRITALRIMETLANEDPEIMFEPVSYAFMDYCRERTAERRDLFNRGYIDTPEDQHKFDLHLQRLSGPFREPSPDDVQYALKALFRIRELGKREAPELEKSIDYDLTRTSFANVQLEQADLSRVNLTGTTHIQLYLINCDLSYLTAETFILERGEIKKCDISGANAFFWDHPAGTGSPRLGGCHFSSDVPPMKFRIRKSDEYKNLVISKSDPADVTWPIILPPDFDGDRAAAEAYYRTAFRALGWLHWEPYLDHLVTLKAGSANPCSS